MISFESRFEIINHPVVTYTEEQIKDEPMLFSCDLGKAYKYGGPLTQAALQHLALAGVEDCIIDSRVHMLMPGWYPCIPGWHHDDIDRTRVDEQPDYKKMDVYHERQHYLLTCNTYVAPTQFVCGQFELPEMPLDGGNIYGMWSPLIDNLVDSGKFIKMSVIDGRWHKFNSLALHRGTAAVDSGWRWFIRATINSNRKVLNEVRKQIQVYLPVLNAGW